MKAVSLFANIGVAEAYLEDIGINVIAANELESKRANLYQCIYPKTEMISGDITDEKIYNRLVEIGKNNEIDVLLATPPCQGFSTAGPQNADDDRNRLIIPILDYVLEVNPKYVFIENVPQFLQKSIVFNEEVVTIPEIIENELSTQYHIEITIVDSKNFSVPQSRERAIILLTRKDQKVKWHVPNKDEEIVTLEDAIGHLPPVDPFVKDISEEEFNKLFPLYEERREKALSISKWHNPPEHVFRQVEAMMHTPSGKSAFENKVFYPKKKDGNPVRGFKNTYKRQNWNTPGYTITMDNRKISSQNNCHPGRFVGEASNGEDLYSDPRTLTLYELMIIMSLPTNWPIPDNYKEAFVRRIIGEGIPPLLVKKIFEGIV